MKSVLTGVFLLWTTIPLVASQEGEVEWLDLAEGSVDDRYETCQEAMMQRVQGGLLDQEKMADPSFSTAWGAAERCSADWEVSHRLTRLHKTALALVAAGNETFPMWYQDDARYLAVSQHVYRNYFLYKSLHFLLTDAVRILKEEQEGGGCRLAYTDSAHRAKVGDQVRLGGFYLASSRPAFTYALTLRTCEGVALPPFPKSAGRGCFIQSSYRVLVPPYELFTVVAAKRSRPPYRYNAASWFYILESQGSYNKQRCALLTDTPRTA